MKTVQYLLRILFVIPLLAVPEGPVLAEPESGGKPQIFKPGNAIEPQILYSSGAAPCINNCVEVWGFRGHSSVIIVVYDSDGNIKASDALKKLSRSSFVSEGPPGRAQPFTTRSGVVGHVSAGAGERCTRTCVTAVDFGNIGNLLFVLDQTGAIAFSTVSPTSTFEQADPFSPESTIPNGGSGGGNGEDWDSYPNCGINYQSCVRVSIPSIWPGPVTYIWYDENGEIIRIVIIEGGQTVYEWEK